MKRVFLRLAIALVTFTLGVSITTIYWLHSLPTATFPSVAKVGNRLSCFPGLSVSVIKSPDHKEFFPLNRFEDDRRTAFRSDWYPKHLQAMNELPLAALVDEEESYRFLWLRTFHHPVAVRVWRSGVRHFIVAKRLNGMGGYDPGTLDLYWAHSLSEDDWDTFLMHLEQSTYWEMEPTTNTVAHDGARWIMEGYRAGRYHLVDRQSPAAGAYRDACLYLLRQSGLLAETPANEVY